MSKLGNGVLVAIVVLICLLAVGSLEVLSQRVRVDRVVTTTAPFETARPELSRPPLEDGVSFEAGRTDDLETAPLSPPAGRLTVLEVHEKDRRLLSVNGRGRVLTTEVAQEAASTLAQLKPGDVVKVEPSKGRAHKIIVLRQEWPEMSSPEQ